MYYLFCWDSYTTDECGMNTYVGAFSSLEAAKEAAGGESGFIDVADIATINEAGQLEWLLGYRQEEAGWQSPQELRLL